MKAFYILALCILIISCSKNNPVNNGYGFYSTTVKLSYPPDSASFPAGNITFKWFKPVADNVTDYNVMINGIYYNVSDTFYTHNFQSAGTYPWMVFASVVDTGTTLLISSEKRYIFIH